MKNKIIRIIIFVLALLFIILGAVQGGFHDTMRRATVICLECVGIG